MQSVLGVMYDLSNLRLISRLLDFTVSTLRPLLKLYGPALTLTLQRPVGASVAVVNGKWQMCVLSSLQLRVCVTCPSGLLSSAVTG